MDAELDKFKREINLAEFAASYGYALDGREYRTGLKMMYRGSTIIIRDDEDGHWIFFDVQGERSGTVIDFVMWQDARCLNIGFARKILREYTGAQKSFSFPASHRTFAKPEPTSRDHAGLMVTWEKMQPYKPGYLEGRGLNPRTVAKFAEHLRTDQRGNTCFRHDDEDGLAGWEVKNKGFTGYAGGGKKALFMCSVGEQEGEPPRGIVIAEGAIDVMSYYQVNPAAGLYVSFAGGLSPEQKAQLSELLTSNPQAAVIIATDKDRQGEEYADYIRSIRPDAERATPPMGKDWNDTLNQREEMAR